MIDRFLMKLSIGYPDRESQVEIMKGRHSADPLDTCASVMDIPTLNSLIEEVGKTHVEDIIYGYITDLVEATRNNEYIQLGVSPRGAISVARTAKAHAFMEGRDYVTVDDVKSVFSDVCAHRLSLSAKARLHELTEKDLIEKILTDTASPEVRKFEVK